MHFEVSFGAQIGSVLYREHGKLQSHKSASSSSSSRKLLPFKP